MAYFVSPYRLWYDMGEWQLWHGERWLCHSCGMSDGLNCAYYKVESMSDLHFLLCTELFQFSANENFALQQTQVQLQNISFKDMLRIHNVSVPVALLQMFFATFTVML